jgi:hypothetical protein
MGPYVVIFDCHTPNLWLESHLGPHQYKHLIDPKLSPKNPIRRPY